MNEQTEEPKFHISKDWRKLTDHEIEVLDKLKQMEQDFLMYLKLIWHTPTFKADRRWLSIARTHIEEASMAARKAVSRPDTIEF